ncbi:MAG: ribulose-phosphate 3-epimerase [Fidelibacterota bacterium]
MTRIIKLAPSILSSDFANLAAVLKTCEEGGADQIHVDVMDGHFVPNLTIGPVVVKALKKSTSLPLDVHLMIENPERYVASFVRAGADMVTVHVEACRDTRAVLDQIRTLGANPGITLRPGTPLESITGFLKEVDLVLVMSVEPGFGGQAFLGRSLERIRKVRGLVDALSPDGRPRLSVDGGIKLDNALQVIEAGAHTLVVGSGIFDHDDPVAVMRAFKELGREKGGRGSE